jgi:hypothetical protein
MTNADGVEIPTETVVETENFMVWRSAEPDGEMTYHLELGSITVHFFEDEWQEFAESMQNPVVEPDDEKLYFLELDIAIVRLDAEEWQEFQALMQALGNV